MLVLSRHRGQVIVIGEGAEAAEVEVVEIRGDKVRLGVRAPKAVPVDRAEIRERKKGGRDVRAA